MLSGSEDLLPPCAVATHLTSRIRVGYYASVYGFGSGQCEIAPLMVGSSQKNSSRAFVWMSERSFRGWICSLCEWNDAVPTLLSDPEAKTSYDRLALGKFRDHTCENFPMRLMPPDSNSVTARLRQLVSKGFKPKDAVELILQEVAMEHRNDPKFLDQAQEDGEDFLRRVRAGII